MMRPYAIPHGQDGAGLRDYMTVTGTDAPRARPPGWPWLILLGFVLGLYAGAKAFAAEPVRFVQPRVPIVLAPPTGTVIPVQLRIDPNAANRAYAITWCDGSSAHTLDGADESALQPAIAPLNVRVGPGECQFTASVFGAGGKVLGSTSFVMHVCGGEGECVPGGSP